MDFPFGTTVTIQHAGTTDPYGDPTPGTSVDVEGCAVAPRSSTDIGGTSGVVERGRNGVLVGLTVFFPSGTVIVDTDRFLIDGVLFQLEGVAGVWRSPFTGWEPGVEAALSRAAG